MLNRYRSPAKLAGARLTVTAMAIQIAISGLQGWSWLPQPGRRGFLYFDG